MILDLKPALAFALIALCTISSKLPDSQSCYFISTLKKDLRSSQNEQIEVGLLRVLIELNGARIN